MNQLSVAEHIPNPRILLLTGIPGSGKSTLAQLVSDRFGWTRISDDDTWPRLFGKNRGQPDTPEGYQKMKMVHKEVCTEILSELNNHRNVVLEFLEVCHPPLVLNSYLDFLNRHHFPYQLRVLRPSFDIALRRNNERSCWNCKPELLVRPWKAQGKLNIPAEHFIDNSESSPDESFERYFNNWNFLVESGT